MAVIAPIGHPWVWLYAANGTNRAQGGAKGLTRGGARGLSRRAADDTWGGASYLVATAALVASISQEG